jgi:hypothetical protein
MTKGNQKYLSILIGIILIFGIAFIYQTTAQSNIDPAKDIEGNVPAKDVEGNVPAKDVEGNVPAKDVEGNVPAKDVEGNIPAVIDIKELLR